MVLCYLSPIFGLWCPRKTSQFVLKNPPFGTKKTSDRYKKSHPKCTKKTHQMYQNSPVLYPRTPAYTKKKTQHVPKKKSPYIAVAKMDTHKSNMQQQKHVFYQTLTFSSMTFPSFSYLHA